MDELGNFLDSLKWVIAGLVGAMVAARYNKSEINGWSGYIVFVLSGTAISYYTSGLAAYYLGLAPEMIGAVSFLMGAFGGSLLQAGINGVKNADLWQIVKSKLGVGK